MLNHESLLKHKKLLKHNHDSILKHKKLLKHDHESILQHKQLLKHTGAAARRPLTSAKHLNACTVVLDAEHGHEALVAFAALDSGPVALKGPVDDVGVVDDADTHTRGSEEIGREEGSDGRKRHMHIYCKNPACSGMRAIWSSRKL